MRSISTLAWVGISLFGTCLQELSFGPKPGVHLVKSFESSLELDLEELTLQYDDLKPNSHLWCEISIAEKRRSVLIDEHAASTELPNPFPLRVFETLELEQRVDCDNLTNDADSHQTYSGRSMLEGERVRFSKGTMTFEGDEPHDQYLLEGLEMDVDFRAFLPDDAQRARNSNTWKVDAASLRQFVEPGGRIEFVDEKSRAAQRFDPGFVASLEGTLQVDFGECRDLAERKLAVLRIHGKPKSTLAPVETEGEVQFGMGYTAPGTNTVRSSLELDVSGEILWDIEGRHLHSAWLIADVVVKRETQGRTPNAIFRETWVRETWRGCLRVEARVTER